MYDQENIFAKILKGDIPSEKIYEDDYVIVMKDINPAASIHLLVLPKGEYIDFADFVAKATDVEVSRYFKTILKVAKEHNIDEYRLVTNKGISAGQSVFHFHTHLLSGGNKDDLSENKLMDDNL